MSHTPGPWKMRNDGTILTLSRTERKAIGQFIGCFSEQQHFIEHFYNNKLIEAAPELLEVIKEILNSDIAMREEDEGEVSPLLEKARKMVEKIGSK